MRTKIYAGTISVDCFWCDETIKDIPVYLVDNGGKLWLPDFEIEDSFLYECKDCDISLIDEEGQPEHELANRIADKITQEHKRLLAHIIGD